MKFKYIYSIAILCLAASFVGCGDDDVNLDDSVFTVEQLAAQNEFDIWLENNFRSTYNTRIVYKFDYMDTDFNYNLTPTKFENATRFTQIMKYCWFELYDEVGGMHFTRETAPKQIYLIGSEGIDYATSSKVLATAGGGLRVVLYELNLVTDFSYAKIKDYMHRMHHEYSHLLDQKKNKDRTFGAISEADYVGDNWNTYTIWGAGNSSSAALLAANKRGFVTLYSASEADEDYAEVYSKYLTLTDAEWEKLLTDATVYSNGVVTNDYGKSTILRKVKMISEYLKESWNVDLDKLRECSLRRALKSEDIEYLPFKEFAQ